MEELVPLILRAKMGDSEAYGVIVSRFQDMAYGYAYAILGDFHLAQDAAQEAFIEAYECLPSLREALAFPAWFKRIAYKHCDRLRRGRRHAAAPLEAAAQVASPLPGPAEEAERSELARRVHEAIRELPVRQRVATTLFYIDGYSHQDIADFLEVPATTVKSRLHRSRSRLRERMVDMVQDELRANALPPDFAQETVEQAVARAGELNKGSRYDQAEQLLREVLTQAPRHPGALREMNRALMQGRVYGHGRWEILPELAEYGRAILQTTDDDYMHHELARTLLAIPAMPEAIAFIEDWIAKKGANIERLGMLAWAKGCVADYEAAEKLWQDVLALAGEAETDDVGRQVPFIAYTLVDCFAAAGDLPRAQRLARQAWEFCRDLGTEGWFNADGDWTTIFRLAELDVREVVRALPARFRNASDPRDQALSLRFREWMDDPETIAAEWLDWLRERIAAGDWSTFREVRWAIGRGMRARGEWRCAVQLAQAVWELLKQADTKEAREQLGFWDCRRFDANGPIEAGDWAAAEEAVRRGIEALGITEGWWLVRIATIRGLSTPPDVVHAVEKKDMDHYNLYDWYVVAREAAAAGDEAAAFDALRKALSYWTNSPYKCCTDTWEKDTYWGELRNHPEFKAAFDERRRRIGPVYGLLHYFPGW